MIDRLPEHQRALELFAERHFDTETARILARSELEQQRRRLDADERPQPAVGRMVGYERQG